MGHHRLLSTLNSNNFPNIILNDAIIEYSTTVNNFWIFMNNILKWNTQVIQTSKKVFSLLHSLKRPEKFSPIHFAKNLIHTFLILHLDYCDSLLTNLSSNLAKRLQRVHNVYVRFICNTRKFDHVTLFLRFLSWVRLKERRMTHSLSFLFKILHASSPNYLTSHFQFLITTRNQQQALLSIPLHRTSSYLDSFTVALHRFWHSLPSYVRDCRTLSHFKIELEKYMLLHEIRY